MAHHPQSLDEILAAQRYIHAKLRKFELDQVTQPFAQTAQRQGLGRAVRGTLQRAALKATTLYDNYVARVADQIENERQRVAEFENGHGESFARDLYHRIRDAPESDIPTYKASRAVFRKLKRDLERKRADQTDNALEKGWHHVKAWFQYYEHSAKVAFAAGALALGTVIMWPLHQHLDHKDHNRPTHYTKYERTTSHPIVASAIAARNLEMYLHETFNQASRVEGARASFAQEYWDFIDCQTCDENNPLSEPQTYNLRFTHNDAGNDWTRPWAFLHREGIARSRERMSHSDKSVELIRQGRNAVNASWNYEKTAEDGHMEEIEVCTTDSDGNESCTSIPYYVCDWKSWRFHLDKPLLMQGVQAANDGAMSFPFEAMPRTDVRPYLTTPVQIVEKDRTLNPKRILKRTEFENAWSKSNLIKNHDNMIGAVDQLAHGSLLQTMLREADGYEVVFDDERASCSGPDHYPHGWNDHTALVNNADAIVGPHDAVYETLKQYEGFVPEIRKQIAIIADEKSSDSQASGAVRELGDLAWKMSNLSDFDGWHPSHATRLFLEWLGFIGISAAAGFGGYALYSKRRYDRYSHRLGGY